VAEEKGVTYDGKVEYIAPKPKMTPAELDAVKKHPLYYYSQIAAKEKGGKKFAEGNGVLQVEGRADRRELLAATPTSSSPKWTTSARSSSGR